MSEKPMWKCKKVVWHGHDIERWIITKEDAKQMLARVAQQRAVDREQVAAYARTMSLNLWEPRRVSQVPVAFDRDWRPINGMRRLLALIESDLASLEFPVVTGLRPEEFEDFDQDIQPRTKKAAHPDVPFVTREQARIAWLERLVSANVMVKMTQPVFRYLLDKTWRGQAAWAREALPNAKEHCRAHYVAALMYAHKLDAAFADGVARQWNDGAGGLPSQLVRLRDDALRSPKGAISKYAAARALFKMLNALAPLHRGEPLPKVLTDNLAGLRYFSQRLKDGAIGRWDRRTVVTGEDVREG